MTTAARTMALLGRRAVLAMAISAGLAGATSAQASAGPVDLTVVDRETGQPLQVWQHRGRLFVAGQPGARYSLRVTNRTGGRVLVVMSVDGVNILTGQTASYSQRGYVFDPYQFYDISGWRKSDHEVAAFTFASLPHSYAARTGRPGDVGVIGIAVFEERVVAPVAVGPAAESRSRPRYESDEVAEVVVGQRAPSSAPPAVRPAPSRGSARAADAARVPPEVEVTARRREEKLGTAHGAREWSAVTTVAFERSTSYPQFIRRIEYDTYHNLVAYGVIRPSPDPGRRPRPFPGNDGGYVPDPPGGR